MTDDEHHTRAMLLGMDFIAHLHAYRKLSGTTIRPNEYIDADTLEPVDAIDLLRRIDGDFEASTHPRPWPPDGTVDHFLGDAVDKLVCK